MSPFPAGRRYFPLAPAIFLAGLASAVAAAHPEVNALVVLDVPDPAAARAVLGSLKDRGGTPAHFLPPDTVLAHIPPGLDGVLLGEKGVAAVYRNDAPPGKGIGRGAGVWNRNFSPAGRARLKAAPSSKKGSPVMVPDAFRRPRSPRYDELKKPFNHVGGSPPQGAGFYDTSEYLIGNPRKIPNIAVGIVMPESDGAIDPQTENWTADEEADIVAEIVAGCELWRTAAPAGVELSFTYTVYARIATSYEPIIHPSDDDELWMNQVMDRVSTTTGIFDPRGYSDHMDKVTAFDNFLRSTYDTDWAFTVFVVNSYVDTDGMFAANADGQKRFGYAGLGGPEIVMTLKNDGWDGGINYSTSPAPVPVQKMHFVLAHEMGHIFYAADEYASSKCATTDFTGYLNVQNLNCENGAPVYACVMRGTASTTVFCPYTAGMVGWRDTNANGAQDITDIEPHASLNAYSPDPTTATSVAYTGQARVVPLANANPYGTGNDIQVDTIRGVDYRLNTGAWTAGAPADGTFNGGIENYAFTASPLQSGANTVSVRATCTTSLLALDKVESSPYSTDILTNSLPEQVSAALSASPAQALEARIVTIILTAANSRPEAVNTIVPYLGVTSGSTLVGGLTGPIPASTASLATGGSASFTWACTTVAPGSVVFTGGVTGIGATTGIGVNAGSVCAVLVYRLLRAVVTVSQAQAVIGRPVTVTLRITNAAPSGGDAADNIVPSLAMTGPGAADVTASPSSAASIPAGQYHDFVWNLLPRNRGSVSVSAAVAGTRSSDGIAVNASGTGQFEIMGMTSAPGEIPLVYPNPVSGGVLYVALPLRADLAEAEVAVYNAASLGLVYKGRWTDIRHADGGVTLSGVDRWRPGMYLLVVTVRTVAGSVRKLAPVKVLVDR